MSGTAPKGWLLLVFLQLFDRVEVIDLLVTEHGLSFLCTST